MGVVRFGETEIRQVPDVLLVAVDNLKYAAFSKHGRIVFRIKSGNSIEEFVAFPGDDWTVEFLIDSEPLDERWVNEQAGSLMRDGFITLVRKP